MNPRQKRRARRLRREMTPTEKKIWFHVRGRRFAEFKFRRQHPVGSFIVDFVCANRGVIIELDGESHVGQEQKDSRRKKWLEAEGFDVIRIWDVEIYGNLEKALELIYETCMRRPPLTPGSLRSPRPSPSRGEGTPARVRMPQTRLDARRV